MQKIQSRSVLQWIAQTVVMVGVIFVLLLGVSVCAYKYRLEVIPYIILSAAAILVCVAIARQAERIGRWAFLAVGVLALSSRLFMLAVWNILPQNDFLTTYEIALHLSRVSVSQWASVLTEVGQLYQDYWCVHMPFILLETLILKMSGGAYAGIQFVFAVFSAGTCVLTAMLGERLFGRRTGILAGLLLIFQPTALFFTSVLSNQHMAAFFCVLGLYLLIAKPLRTEWGNAVTAGTALAFSQLMRPEMYVTLAAVACYEIYMLLALRGKSRSEKFISIKKAVIRLVGIFFIFFAILLLCNTALRETGMIRGSMFEGNFSYKLAVGLNEESQGEWNASDADVCNDSEELNRRIRERLQSPGKAALLMVRKEGALLGSYDYGWCAAGKSGYVAERFFPLVSEAYMLLVLLCAVIFGICSFKRGGNEQILLWLFLFAFFGVFALIEVQNRYNYLFLPALCVMASGIITLQKMISKNSIIDRVCGNVRKKV